MQLETKVLQKSNNRVFVNCLALQTSRYPNSRYEMVARVCRQPYMPASQQRQILGLGGVAPPNGNDNQLHDQTEENKKARHAERQVPMEFEMTGLC